MILNSKRFTLRLTGDKYLADIEKIREELKINRRANYYLDIRLVMPDLPAINVYMAETNLYICGWTGNKVVIYFGDLEDPALHAPEGFKSLQQKSVRSDYGSLGVGSDTALKIDYSEIGSALIALSQVTEKDVITGGHKNKAALLAIAVAEATRFRNISRAVNSTLLPDGPTLTSSTFWKITHDWEDRSRYASINVAVKSPGL